MTDFRKTSDHTSPACGRPTSDVARRSLSLGPYRERAGSIHARIRHSFRYGKGIWHTYGNDGCDTGLRSTEESEIYRRKSRRDRSVNREIACRRKKSGSEDSHRKSENGQYLDASRKSTRHEGLRTDLSGWPIRKSHAQRVTRGSRREADGSSARETTDRDDERTDENQVGRNRPNRVRRSGGEGAPCKRSRSESSGRMNRARSSKKRIETSKTARKRSLRRRNQIPRGRVCGSDVVQIQQKYARMVVARVRRPETRFFGRQMEFGKRARSVYRERFDCHERLSIQ